MNKRIVYATCNYWDAVRYIKAHTGRHGIMSKYHIHYVLRFEEIR